MWLAVIGGQEYTSLRLDVQIIAINISTLFACSSSNMYVSPAVLCDGIYHCIHYEDELACNYSATYLEEGYSHFIYIPDKSIRRSYDVALVKTNSTYGFRVVFRDLYLRDNNVVVIGTGLDPSDTQSVVTTIRGNRNYADDVYVENNEMWLAVIGGQEYARLRLDVQIFAINISDLFRCISTNEGVPVTLVCDGRYHCDNYEDELSCNQSTAFLHPDEYTYLSVPVEARLINVFLLKTNLTAIFRVEFPDGTQRGRIQIGTGGDPSDTQSVVRMFDEYSPYTDDMYVESNAIWITLIGSETYNSGNAVNLKVSALESSDILLCGNSGTALPRNDLCNGVYSCPNYEDETQCGHPSIFLHENEYYSSMYRPTHSDIHRETYSASLFKTNDTHGFQVRLGCYCYYCNGINIQIGSGNDPANSQSIVRTVVAFTSYEDIYIGTMEMWIAVTANRIRRGQLCVDIVISPVSLSNLISCSNDKELIVQSEICDGTHQCNDYSDEKTCNHPDILLDEGSTRSVHITLPDIAVGSYSRTSFRTNSKLGFHVRLSNINVGCCGVIISMGTGSDSRNVHNITITRTSNAHDIYVTTNAMWVDVIGGEAISSGHVEIDVTSVTLPEPQDLYFCSTNSTFGILQSRTCDGTHDCTNYEDEFSCDQSAAFLEDDETFDLKMRIDGYQQSYRVWLFETNSSNGFVVELDNVYLYCVPSNYDDCEFTFQIGMGKDSTNQESVITTYNAIEIYRHGYEKWYVDHHEMWISTIGSISYYYSYTNIHMNVTATRASGWFICRDSNISISQHDVCDGRYECDNYEDEKSCVGSITTIGEGGSYAISNFDVYRRAYNVSLLKTNSSHGFRIKFQHIYLDCCNMRVQIGTGNDPSDGRSIVRSIEDYANYVGDVYVRTSEMWLSIAGGNLTVGHVDIVITTFIVSEDECLSAPCQNGGNCHRLFDIGYQCACLDPFIGRNCETGSADPCAELNPCINGDCRNIGRGQYECECQNQYDGINCDESTLPIEVSIHPSNQTVKLNSDVELSCSFTNAKQYHWYKDDVLLPNTENKNPLIIPSVTPDDIGYYFCRGSGRNGQTVDTMRASVYVKDLTNIAVLNVRFAIPFGDELYDTASNLYRETKATIRTYMQQGLMTSTGLMGLSAVCRGLRPGSIMADMNIYIEETSMTAFETQDLISHSLDSLANNSNGYLDSSNIYVQNTAICQNISWMSPRFGRVAFPANENGTWANSTGFCPFNTTQANGPIGRALCIGDGITQSQWLPIDNCGPIRNVTDILIEIAQVVLTEENAGEVSKQVSIVTTNTEQITADDITSVAKITSQIVLQNLTSEEVTVSITSIVSNIAQVESDELEAAEEENGAISQFVQAFEEQINRVAVVDGGILNIQEQNVAVQVQSISADDVMSGLVLSVAGSSFSDLSKSNITIDAPTQDDGTATRPDIIAQVNIPHSVSSAISSGSQTNGSDYIRVNFHLFSTPVLFISRSLRNISAVNNDFNRSANSPVISLSLGEGQIAALPEFINFTFTTIMPGYVNPMCSFWDEDEEDWSQDGCVLVSSSGITSADDMDDGCENIREVRQDDSIDEIVHCACNHLTNFAVIMDIHRQEDTSIKAYNILTYIGCSVSIFSLLITLATYLYNKDLRTKQTNQIFICLCLTLLCLYITFMTMMSLDSIRDHCEVPAIPCGVLSALVHYFVLSSIAWMGVEGYNTYLVIVKIFNAYIPNFMKKAVLAAWGVPALIVVLTGAIARDYYAHGDFCFLQFWAQIGGLLIPMSVILLINIVIFILVVRQLVRSANIAGRVKRGATVERRETIERVQNAICILLLLGLTWVTGYLLLIPVFSKVAQPIFIVLNSFQGLFIFLLYCVRKPHIRKRWGLTCFDKFLKRKPSTSSGVQSSTPLSSSTGTISGLRPGISDSSYFTPSKGTKGAYAMSMFNSTFDVDLVDEEVTPPIKDLPSFTEDQENGIDGKAPNTDDATFFLPLGESVTKAI